MEMFTNHEQTVPHTQLGIKAKLPNYKQNTLNLPDPPPDSTNSPSPEGSKADDPTMTPENHADITLEATEPPNKQMIPHSQINEASISHQKCQALPKYAMDLPQKLRESSFTPLTVQEREKILERSKNSFSFTTTADEISDDVLIEEAEEFEARLPSLITVPNIRSHSYMPTTMTSPLSKLSCYARRSRANKATITIGDRDPITTGNSPPSSPSKRRKVIAPETGGSKIVKLGRLGQPKFSSGVLSRFAAPKAQTQFREEERQGEPEEEADDFGPELVKGHKGIGREMEIQGPDEMVLDENQYIDKDPDEISTDASELGETIVVPDQVGSNQSFIPNVEFSAIGGDEIMDGEGDSSVENDEEVEPDEDPEDDDFMDEYEFLKQSSIRAQKLFEQAEDSVAKPTSKNLERAFEILEGSPAYTTRRVFGTCSTSVAQLKKQLGSLGKLSTGITAKTTSPSNSTLTEDDLSAEERLNLTISKKDFFEMQIKGQFNKGFILTTRKDDLFIIDQHASDEKYNFETLQLDTVVQNQRLVVPKTLELMAMDEVIVTEHLDVFKKNGFIIEVDPEAPTGARCRLISLPLSKETVFGIKDLEELIHLVHEDQGNSSVRCSKVRSMFAMRACKKSTKVGRALTIKGMRKIVRHMVYNFLLGGLEG
jgi:DNA mismatch repair protein PMS2